VAIPLAAESAPAPAALIDGDQMLIVDEAVAAGGAAVLDPLADSASPSREHASLGRGVVGLAQLGRNRAPSEMEESWTRFRDQAVTITRCARCDWSSEGTAAEGREAALAHRDEHHPETRGRHGGKRDKRRIAPLL
jgi:hypothetical protein